MAKTHAHGARRERQVGVSSDGVAVPVAIGPASVAPHIGQQKTQVGWPAGSNLIDLRVGRVGIEAGVPTVNRWSIFRRQAACNRN